MECNWSEWLGSRVEREYGCRNQIVDVLSVDDDDDNKTCSPIARSPGREDAPTMEEDVPAARSRRPRRRLLFWQSIKVSPTASNMVDSTSCVMVGRSASGVISNMYMYRTARLRCSSRAIVQAMNVLLRTVPVVVGTTGASVTGASVMGAKDTGVDVTGESVTGADDTGMGVTGAGVTGEVVTGADVTGADVTGADVTGADVTGAAVTGADVTGAFVTGAGVTGGDGGIGGVGT